MVGGKGAQDMTIEAGVLVNDGDGPFVLRHGALTQNLAGKEKGCPDFTHIIPSLLYFQNSAINAWVNPFSVTVFWILDHFQVLVPHGNLLEGNSA